MERKKFCAGLIAVAMGLAFSFGNASAYDQGDFANAATEGKLVPYYMAGENMATIIGVDNQSGGADVVRIIEVAAFDVTGEEQASGEICLADNQFGYAVLQEEMMADGETRVGLVVGVGDQTASIYGISEDPSMTGVKDRAGSTVTTMPGEGSMIAAEGYVVVSDLGHYTIEAGQLETDTSTSNDGCDSTTFVTPAIAPNFAAWAILQDVGEGSFFGTEIPTATVNAAEPTPDGVTPNSDGITCDVTTNVCAGLMTPASTEQVTATTRFDVDMMNNSESMIYLWLGSAETGFSDTTGEPDTRMFDAMVYCEGEEVADMELNLPNSINTIDAMDLGCDARGVLQLALGADTPGLMWSHIAQEGGGFRMNFAGYEASATP